MYRGALMRGQVRSMGPLSAMLANRILKNLNRVFFPLFWIKYSPPPSLPTPSIRSEIFSYQPSKHFIVGSRQVIMLYHIKSYCRLKKITI